MLRDSHQSDFPQKVEKIICSSIWYKELPLEKEEGIRKFGNSPYNIDKGIVISGWRHSNCMHTMIAITGLRSVKPECGEYVQGFLTNNNRFVDRIEGAEIALSSGQVEKLTFNSKMLYSEDLY